MSTNIDHTLAETLKAAFAHAADVVVTPSFTLDPTGAGKAHVVVKDGYKVVTIEPSHRPAVRHQFDDLGSLATWLKRRAPRAQDVDILLGKSKTSANLAPHSTEADIVTCPTNLTPRAAFWVDKVLGKALDQRSVIRVLTRTAEDFLPLLAKDGAHLGTVGEDLLSRIGSIEAKRITSFTKEVDARGFTKLASASADTTLSVQLPPVVVIRIPMIQGVTKLVKVLDAETETAPLYEIRAQLVVNLPDGGAAVPPAFTFDPLNLDDVMAEALSDAAAFLQRKLGDEFAVLRGKEDSIEVVERVPHFTTGTTIDSIPSVAWCKDGPKPAPTDTPAPLPTESV